MRSLEALLPLVLGGARPQAWIAWAAAAEQGQDHLPGMRPSMNPPPKAAGLIVYGDTACGLARMLAEALAEHGIAHEWRDVQHGERRFRDELRRLARGHLSVPTVIFPDGSVLIEPWPDEVLEKLQSLPGYRRSE